MKDRVLVRRIAPFVLAGLASLASVAPASAAERTMTFNYGAVTLGGYQVKRDTAFPRVPKVDGFITAMRARSEAPPEFRSPAASPYAPGRSTTPSASTRR